jgi:toxin FitB
MLAVADTSVIISAVLQSGDGHQDSIDAIRSSSAAAAGHAWIESFSVLTRLPSDVRLTAADAATVLISIIPLTRFLSAEEQTGFASWMGSNDVVGGAVYDALVGWVSKCAAVPLLTRDARALPTYRRLGVDTMLIGPTLA